MKQTIKEFFEKDTGTFSYVVSDREAGKAAIIDPVLSFKPETGQTDTAHAEAILAYLGEENLDLEWILETHAHADHLSAAQFLKARTGAGIGIGKGIVHVQAHFKNLFMLDHLQPDGSQFDRLFAAGDKIEIGGIEMEVIAMPGHTGDSVAYRAGDAVFVGDTLFMPDVGTARCDFPGGDAATLYQSIKKLLELPDETRLFMCHDYPTEGRGPMFVSTVAEQKRDNIHVGGGRSEVDFVNLRLTRDKSLKAPRLILPSLQVNINAGHLPGVGQNGIAYLVIPLNQI